MPVETAAAGRGLINIMGPRKHFGDRDPLSNGCDGQRASVLNQKFAAF